MMPAAYKQYMFTFRSGVQCSTHWSRGHVSSVTCGTLCTNDTPISTCMHVQIQHYYSMYKCTACNTACKHVLHVQQGIQHVLQDVCNMYCRMYVVDMLHMYMYICNTRLCYHSQTTQPSQSSCGYHNSGRTEPISHSLLGLMTVVYINCFVSPISSLQITYSPLNSNFVSE